MDTNKRRPKKTPSTKPFGDPTPINTIDQLKAIAHPLRLQLLEQFANSPATAKQIAKKLGYQPTRLYHHVAKLEHAGLIKLVETKQVRGTTEKYYSTVSSNLKIDRSAFQGQSAQLVSEIAALGILDSLLGVIRLEFSEYLAQRDDDVPGPDHAEQEGLFMGAEIETDESSVLLLREKLKTFVEEFRELAETKRGDGKDMRKYRLMVGWYPRAKY